MKRSPDESHRETRYISMIRDEFLDQKRVNVCTGIERRNFYKKMQSCPDERYKYKLKEHTHN